MTAEPVGERAGPDVPIASEGGAPDQSHELETVIEPGHGWALRLGELWAYRELLYFMVWRDVKVRYRQTLLGVLWAVLQPIALTAVFALFLGQLQGIAPSSVPYALFALSALVPWQLFAQSLMRSSESLVGSANLLTKVYFPRLLLPLASVGTPALDFGFGLAVLLGAATIMSFPPTLAVLWLAPLALLAVAAALAVGILLAALNVRYRDVRHMVPFLVQLWFFATPIIYSAELVPEALRGLYFLNPMAGVVAGFRWAVLGEGVPPAGPVILSIAVTALVFALGLLYFRRVERAFADVI